MNQLFEIFSDVLRLATLQPRRRTRRNPRDVHNQWGSEEPPFRFRSERHGGERFFG